MQMLKVRSLYYLIKWSLEFLTYTGRGIILGFLTPSPARECVFPLGHQGREEQHSLAGEGMGAQFGQLDRKPGIRYTLSISVCRAFADHHFPKQ
jgi:hypothetical protein